jgi:hypothetical protein
MIITRGTSGFRYICSFIYPTLATRSGAALRIAIYSPDVGNTLEGGASQPDASDMLGSYAYMLALAFAPLAPGVDNTLGGYASHTANLSRTLYCLLHLKQHTVDHIDSSLYC